jgi:hypothetical protein
VSDGSRKHFVICVFWNWMRMDVSLPRNRLCWMILVVLILVMKLILFLLQRMSKPSRRFSRIVAVRMKVMTPSVVALLLFSMISPA